MTASFGHMQPDRGHGGRRSPSRDPNRLTCDNYSHGAGIPCYRACLNSGRQYPNPAALQQRPTAGRGCGSSDWQPTTGELGVTVPVIKRRWRARQGSLASPDCLSRFGMPEHLTTLRHWSSNSRIAFAEYRRSNRFARSSAPAAMRVKSALPAMVTVTVPDQTCVRVHGPRLVRRDIASAPSLRAARCVEVLAGFPPSALISTSSTPYAATLSPRSSLFIDWIASSSATGTRRLNDVVLLSLQRQRQ